MQKETLLIKAMHFSGVYKNPNCAENYVFKDCIESKLSSGAGHTNLKVPLNHSSSLEAIISLMENAESYLNCEHDVSVLMEQSEFRTLIFPSELCAIIITLKGLCSSSSTVLIAEDLYNHLLPLIENELLHNGINFEVFDPMLGVEHIVKKIKPKTIAVFMRIMNPITLQVFDLDSIISIAQKHGIITVIENSIPGSIYFQPLKWGADVSLNGFSPSLSCFDTVHGLVTAKSEILSKIYKVYLNYGLKSCHDKYSALNNLYSSYLKHQCINFNLEKIIQYLNTIKEVKCIMHPYVDSFPYAAAWHKYLDVEFSFINVVLDQNYSPLKIRNMLSHTQIFGVNYGFLGKQSFIAEFDFKQYFNLDKQGNILRLYIGSEHYLDLIADLERAFKRLKM